MQNRSFHRDAGLYLIWILTIFGYAAGRGYAQMSILDAQPPSIARQKPGVKVEVVPQYAAAEPEKWMALAVVLDVAAGWHLYANPKLGQFGLDTEIIPKNAQGVVFGKIEYPPGEKYEDKTLDADNHIYVGRTICYVPVKVTSRQPGAITVQLELKGLLCSERGSCVPWSDSISTELRGADGAGPPQQNRPELFAGYHPTRFQSESGVVTGRGEKTPEHWFEAISLAAAAGLLMNLMPCVLPIIPIIVMTLIRQCATGESETQGRGRSVRIGLVFAAGIMVVFAALAVMMSVFKLLWGQQFQGNGFKLTLLLVVYVLSLSMFGLFEIVLPARLTNISVVRKGYLGTLAMGMLATVLATPCGAPLITPVLTWSLGRSLPITVAVFLIIGAGMAAPYVILTAFPKLLNRIPRAGNWMMRLKQAVGFAMLAFSVYLILLFPTNWHGPLFYFCLLVGFCLWLGFGLVGHAQPGGRGWAVRLLAAILLAGGAIGLAGEVRNSSTPQTVATEYWLTQLNACQLRRQTAIVKFTANWCKNCAALEKLIYHRREFNDKLAQGDAKLIIADWSYPDPEIRKMIYDLGGPGQALPFAVVFPGGDHDHPILLRDFYSLDDTIRSLDEAAKRK
jgi:thiol:disulfide interchange protein